MTFRMIPVGLHRNKRTMAAIMAISPSHPSSARRRNDKAGSLRLLACFQPRVRILD
jgi:hypothetical protein